MDRAPQQRLLDLDAFLLQVLNDPVRSGVFFAATTPAQIVDLASECGHKIAADDFCTLLQSNSGEFWVYGSSTMNPINHLQKVFSV